MAPDVSRGERLFPAAVALAGGVVLLGVAELDAEFLRQRLWAFDHLRDMPRWSRWLATLVLLAVATPRARELVLRAARVVAGAPRLSLTAGLAGCSSLFWILRQRNFELGDGLLLTQLLTRYVHLRGYHVTYDEPLELYLHSVVYRWLHTAFDWGVQDSYALSSVLAGAGFLVVMWALWRHAAPTAERRVLGLGLVLSTAGVQLFFGYVENYTLVLLGLAAYLLLAQRRLACRVSLFWPAFLLGWSICLHVLAGWLLPSLLYLWNRSRLAGKGWRALLQAAIGLVLPPLATVGYLTAIGVPTELLGKTHLAHLKFVFFTEPGTPQFRFGFLSPDHLAAQGNQLLLAGLPGLLLIGWLLTFARRELDTRDPFLRFLALGAISLQLFASTWNPELGAYQDWDLFAVAGLFLTLLGAVALTRLDCDDSRLRRAALPILALCLTLTGSWVTSNARRSFAVHALHDDAHYRSALRHEREGSSAAAEADLIEAIRANPRNGAAVLALVTVLHRDGRAQEAREPLESYLAGEPTGRHADVARRILRELDASGN